MLYVPPDAARVCVPLIQPFLKCKEITRTWCWDEGGTLHPVRSLESTQPSLLTSFGARVSWAAGAATHSGWVMLAVPAAQAGRFSSSVAIFGPCLVVDGLPCCWLAPAVFGASAAAHATKTAAVGRTRDLPSAARPRAVSRRCASPVPCSRDRANDAEQCGLHLLRPVVVGVSLLQSAVCSNAHSAHHGDLFVNTRA